MSLNNNQLNPRLGLLGYSNSEDNNEDNNEENGPPIARRLSFSNNNEYQESESFETYSQKRIENITNIVDELLNYDKDRLIEKIIDDVEDIDASSLLLKNFGELWDILIDDRIKKYKQTFKDK